MCAELLEDRLVPAPVATHHIFIVGTAVDSSVAAHRVLLTDPNRFNDGIDDAGSVKEIGNTINWVAPNLRSAVSFANSLNAGNNTIYLETTAAAKPYLVVNGEIDFFQSTGTLTIKDFRPGLATLDAQQDNRIFSDYGGALVTLDHLKLTDGFAGAEGNAPIGGAIANFETMHLTNDQFIQNSAFSTDAGNGPEGGAIYNNGTMTLVNDLLGGNSVYGGTFSDPATPVLGGALFNDTNAALSIANSTFYLNTAGGQSDDFGGANAAGGAIYLDGLEPNTVAITNSSFYLNRAVGGSFAGGEGFGFQAGSAYGGAIASGDASVPAATLNLTGCTFDNNSAQGGSAQDDTSGSGFSGSAYGGALYLNINANIVNCTLTCNQVQGGDSYGGSAYGGGSYGGGIFGDFTSEDTHINLVNDTIAFNSSLANDNINGPPSGDAYGGGVLALQITSGPRESPIRGAAFFSQVGMNVVNTIIAKNTADDGGPDVAGAFNSAGHNLIGAADGAVLGFTNGVHGDQVGTVAHPVNPGFSPIGLAFNGGPTPTIALVPGSNAVNKGDNTFAGFVPAPKTDQRGFPRIAGGIVDIGAYELQPFGRGRGRDSLGLYLPFSTPFFVPNFNLG